MASNSNRRSGSSDRSKSRKRVVIGAEETVRVSYDRSDRPRVEAERKRTSRSPQRAQQPKSPSRIPQATGAGRRVAADKRDQRERRRRAVGRRRALVGVGIVAALAVVVWGLSTLWTSPVFSASEVEVTGTHRLAPSAVATEAAIAPGTTLLQLSPGQVERRLLADPWIQAASVSRVFPHKVAIEVTERTPVAVVDVQGTPWLVSSDGRWIVTRSASDTQTIPLVRDVPSGEPATNTPVATAEVVNAMAVIAGLSPELAGQVKFVTAPSVEKTALVLANDVQVFVGSATDIARKDLIARGILRRQKNLVYINVRIVDRPTWRGLDESN
jgi:cell division protein FtsQ